MIGEREAVAGIAERVVARYGAHDADALGGLYSQECTLTAGGMVLRGREEITAFWKAWFEAFPDVASTNDHTLVDPPHFLFDWVEEGTHTGSLRIAGAEFAPTGRRISWCGASLYTVDAGEIVSVLYHADQAGLMTQLTSG